ncbi:hypothetical protein [Glycomyces tenuis]|uniref:hypothetical protein n=1 Tax=Glycomyces tenuis TaxID=58116 RepID=UPI0004139117|nr:hypothetical protein [Glycomyces tenuis]
MARTEARLRTRLWGDRDFLALSFKGKGGYESILCQPDVEYTGVLPLRARRLAGLFGLDLEDFIEMLEELEDARFVLIDWDTEELLIRTFIRNDEVYRQPNVMKSAQQALDSVSSLRLRAEILTELHRIEDEHGDSIPKGSHEPLREMIADLEKDPPIHSPVTDISTKRPKAEPKQEALTEPNREPFGEPFPEGGSDDSLEGSGEGVGVRGVSSRSVVSNSRSAKADRTKDDPEFARWYERYPRKVKPAAARTAWKSAVKKTDVATLFDALEAYIAYWERERTDTKFIPHPSSWLNAESWGDDIATRKTATTFEGAASSIWD